MYDRLAAALLGLTAGAGHIHKVAELPASRPRMRSAKRKGTTDKLLGAYETVGNEILGHSPKANVVAMPPPQTMEQGQQALLNPQIWNTHVPKGVESPDPSFEWDKDLPSITANLNSDRVYIAKSLGGAISGQTRVGNAVQQTRKKLQESAASHPMLAKALMLSTFLAPAGYSAAVAGDEDTDEALAIALAPAIPALLDESVATINGQRILDASGLRTSLGQRGKLAGNLLSYAAPAVVAGSLGNFAGNLIDQDPKSPGELPVS